MLDDIVLYKKGQFQRSGLISGIKRFERMIENLPAAVSLKNNLTSEPGISIIAEIKRRSPSKGDLAADFDAKQMAQFYERAGAKAISVLTEDKFFGGSISDLKGVKENSSLPVLRKEFIINEYQLWESRAIGADAVLLIVKILTSDELSRLYNLAGQLGLEVVVEVHSRDELETVLPLRPVMIGINNRDLLTFETDLAIFESLIGDVPESTLSISESGVFSRADVLFLQNLGADAALIGESIMTSKDPYLKIRELRGVT
ncbi:MAG: indole-3-glycerol phosphate synthase TrpC [Candidatus Zixiibacteriota bacterium]|nr:MAG: indole-3-glycerol phosphate synthase TrpC [candidate division Zixibacteria bacterium]